MHVHELNHQRIDFSLDHNRGGCAPLQFGSTPANSSNEVLVTQGPSEPWVDGCLQSSHISFKNLMQFGRCVPTAATRPTAKDFAHSLRAVPCAWSVWFRTDPNRTENGAVVPYRSMQTD